MLRVYSLYLQQFRQKIPLGIFSSQNTWMTEAGNSLFFANVIRITIQGADTDSIISTNPGENNEYDNCIFFSSFAEKLAIR